MNDFRPTQVVKIKEGDTEKVFPLYDLNSLRACLLYTDDIPQEIHENLKANSKQQLEVFKPVEQVTEEVIAVVGYGPTLKQYWSKLKDYKKIISTSGAHKFLIDRGIIPTYHVEVDFRERKAVHTASPHPDVQYLMSKTVHPATLGNGLAGGNVKLWNLRLDGISYPEGEFVVPGYWDVGQEAILMARLLGHVNIHLFGLDYAYEIDNEETHAGFHNGAPSKYVFANVGNKIYRTSDSSVRGVMAFEQLMKDNTDLNLTIVGEGLLSSYLNYHYLKERTHETASI